MMRRFTERYVFSPKPKLQHYEIHSDGEQGFSLRISHSELKTWISRYKTDGRTRKHTHANFPENYSQKIVKQIVNSLGWW